MFVCVCVWRCEHIYPRVHTQEGADALAFTCQTQGLSGEVPFMKGVSVCEEWCGPENVCMCTLSLVVCVRVS